MGDFCIRNTHLLYVIIYSSKIACLYDKYIQSYGQCNFGRTEGLIDGLTNWLGCWCYMWHILMSYTIFMQKLQVCVMNRRTDWVMNWLTDWEVNYYRRHTLMSYTYTKLQMSMINTSGTIGETISEVRADCYMQHILMSYNIFMQHGKCIWRMCPEL